ncbi:unnamed protein product [Rotaria sp. Silwood2]|nr:unnamed protein product [Rotaria sp. Silwood2]CAF3225218.1 unnamed protein product [Rotaria sp. Silwood2]CAF3877460.1 unnamed protein product [Rotaria sp. Silwood2]CAF3918213.1 unnamed protein product [Rotaria sp. Silwood2]
MTSKHPYVYTTDQKINPLLICCICQKPFVDPVTTVDHRRGCRACLTEYSSHRLPSVTPIQEWIVLEMLNSLLVECTRCKEINIRRGDLKQHEEESCKRAFVLCKAADIKCPWKGVREELDAHLEQCVFEPLRPVLAEIIMGNKQFKEKIDTLEILIKKFTKEIK